MSRLAAIGLDSDTTFRRFVLESARSGVEVYPINLRQIAALGDWRISVPDDGESHIRVGADRLTLSPETGYFCRPISLGSVEQEANAKARWRGLELGLKAWLDWTPARVVNRPRAHRHNSAKPYHELWLASHGLAVPPSVTSCDRTTLQDFAADGRAVVKACSGVRAHSNEVGPRDFDNFDPRQGPVHLQRMIVGADVRAHVIGDEVFAQLITSSGVDYRRPGGTNRYELHKLPTCVEDRIIAATNEMGLEFAGWDFKRSTDGAYWCLEANPMPGYASYDHHAEGAITRRLLALFKAQPS